MADGALNEVHDMLHRMNELAVQAANDTNTKYDREAIQNEIEALVDEIDRIGEDTEYNSMSEFDGWAGLSGKPKLPEFRRGLDGGLLRRQV